MTVLNFVAFNLLFFALYLNFIHRDNNSSALAVNHAKIVAGKGTVIVANPNAYLKSENKPSSMAH